MTTTMNDVPAAAVIRAPTAARTELSVRELVAELAAVEDGLRQRPNDPDLVREVRLLVRELRRRRALTRVRERSATRAGRTS